MVTLSNDPIPGWADSFDTKHGYFTAPLRKKTVDPGIDVYNDECWVIYDPERPPYWIPVTVEEAFAAAREFAAKERMRSLPHITSNSLTLNGPPFQRQTAINQHFSAEGCHESPQHRGTVRRTVSFRQ